MLSLSVSGLSLASTYSQIETLRRDSNALSKAIAGLAVTTGRSFPSQFEELISEGKYLITYSSNWAPFKYYVSMFLAFLGPPTHLCHVSINSTVNQQKFPFSDPIHLFADVIFE